jgi:hypothetical protein
MPSSAFASVFTRNVSPRGEPSLAYRRAKTPGELSRHARTKSPAASEATPPRSGRNAGTEISPPIGVPSGENLRAETVSDRHAMTKEPVSDSAIFGFVPWLKSVALTRNGSPSGCGGMSRAETRRPRTFADEPVTSPPIQLTRCTPFAPAVARGIPGTPQASASSRNSDPRGAPIGE